MNNKEIWKDIKGYEGLYQVSNLGRIKSLKQKEEKILNIFKDNIGYLSVNLQTKEKVKKRERVHRLVAKTFILNPENKPQVNHKDGNKLNNNVNNLEWCTCKENVNHSWENNLSKPYWKGKFGINHKSSKAIYKIDIISKKIIKKYDSIEDAKKELNINSSNISKCCKGKMKTSYGYIWRYANENQN